MLKFTTNGKNGNHVLTYPTDLKELTGDILANFTHDIEVAPNYSLIAVCYREKIHNVLLTARQNKKDMTTSVVPIFVKEGPRDSHFPPFASIGDKLIIAPSQIALGHHVSAPLNPLTITKLLYYTEGDGMAYQHALKHNEYVYFLEFKLVPNCDIVGVYTDNKPAGIDNPFAIVDATEGAV